MEKIKLTDNNTNQKQPSNIEAEQALLGSILVNNDIIDEISLIINPSSFYDPAHNKIYEVNNSYSSSSCKYPKFKIFSWFYVS